LMFFYHYLQVYGETIAKIQIQKLFLQNLSNFTLLVCKKMHTFTAYIIIKKQNIKLC